MAWIHQGKHGAWIKNGSHSLSVLVTYLCRWCLVGLSSLAGKQSYLFVKRSFCAMSNREQKTENFVQPQVEVQIWTPHRAVMPILGVPTWPELGCRGLTAEVRISGVAAEV